MNGPTELKEKITDLYRRIGCGFIKEEEGDFFHAEVFNDIAHFVTKRGHGPKERMHSVIAKVFDIPVPKLAEKRRRWSSPMMLAIDWLYHEDDEEEKERTGFVNQWENAASRVWKNSYLVVTFLNKCYVVDRPAEVHFNEIGFHNTKGPAILFRDGTETYCYEGLLVDKRHITDIKSLTLKDIHQHNSRKHYLIDLVGVDRYLEMVKAWKVPETKGRFKKEGDPVWYRCWVS